MGIFSQTPNIQTIDDVNNLFDEKNISRLILALETEDFLSHGTRVSNLDIRRHIINGLGKLGDDAKLPLIKALSHHWDKGQQKAVLNCLGIIGKNGDKSVLPAINEMFNDKKIAVRMAAASALLSIEDPSSIIELENNGFTDEAHKLRLKLLSKAVKSTKEVRDALSNIESNIQHGSVNENDSSTLNDQEIKLNKSMDIARDVGDSKVIQDITILIESIGKLRPSIETTFEKDSMVTRPTININDDANEDIISQLERLSALKKDGLLSDEQFEAAKEKLLS